MDPEPLPAIPEAAAVAPVGPGGGRPAKRRAPWGLGDVAFGMVAGLALSSLLASAWLAGSGDTDLSLGGQALSEVGLWTGLVGAVVLASRRKGSGRLSRDFGFRARWRDIGIGLGVALLVQIVLLPAISVALRPVFGQPEVSGPVKDLMDKAGGLAFAGLVLTVAVGAPLVEELFFRGLLLRSLQRRLPDSVAVALSAAAFGLAHASALPGDALALVVISLTAFGAVLAVLAIRTGRLGPGIVAHACFNLFTIVYLATTR